MKEAVDKVKEEMRKRHLKELEEVGVKVREECKKEIERLKEDIKGKT